MFNTLKNYNINFGPQHPAAHGVLRLILEMRGERVVRLDPHIGLLHRGTEKLAEYKNYLQILPYLDRLDYVSMMVQEHAYSLAVEKALKLGVPARAQFIRVMFSEITRILNHLMAVTTHALDVGALTPFLWAFEEREKLMEFYERVSGARMHASYIRPGGVAQDIPKGFLHDLFTFIEQFRFRIDEIEELLSTNKIWRQRLLNIGLLSYKTVKNWSLSGVLLRSTGLFWDLRKVEPYEIYNQIPFVTYISYYGDSYDRYLLRICEMRESIKIIKFCLDNIPMGPIKLLNDKYVVNSRSVMKLSMEALINHFKMFTQSFVIPSSFYYTGVEAPKGEFGVFMLTNNSNVPYRIKFRAPGFFHLQALKELGQNLFLADIVTLIGTLDIVFGEIDR